jgi:hypothetical protein
MTAVSDPRSGATLAGAPVSRDPRGARWAYLAGATGAAANALLVTFFASIPAAGRENPFGPANDIVGSVATASMIPAAVAIGRHLPPRGRLRALHTATLGSLGVATAAGPLLVAGVLPFKVSSAASTGAFGVQLAWIGLGSGWLGRNAGLPRRGSSRMHAPAARRSERIESRIPPAGVATTARIVVRTDDAVRSRSIDGRRRRTQPQLKPPRGGE